MKEKDFIEMAAQLRKPEGENGVRTGEFMNRGNEVMNREAIRLLQAPRASEILEIGMGNGRFVSELLAAYSAVRYTGVDFSDTMLEEAAKINAEAINGGKVRFLKDDINSLRLEDKMFDTVFTINTIYFWGKSDSALSELRRVLKPGGILLISLRPRRHMESYPFTKYGFTLYEPDEVSTLLTQNGFKNVSIQLIQEPDLELNGQMLKMEHAVVKGEKA